MFSQISLNLQKYSKNEKKSVKNRKPSTNSNCLTKKHQNFEEPKAKHSTPAAQTQAKEQPRLRGQGGLWAVHSLDNSTDEWHAGEAGKY